jgi:hypothetical protein
MPPSAKTLGRFGAVSFSVITGPQCPASAERERLTLRVPVIHAGYSIHHGLPGLARANGSLRLPGRGGPVMTRKY